MITNTDTDYNPQGEAFDYSHLTDKATPLDAKQCEDFDFAEIYRLVDGEEAAERDYEKLGNALRAILQWIIEPEKRKPLGSAGILNLIGKRAVALAWATSPDMFEGGPTGAQLARKLRLSPVRLQEKTGEASRVFGVRNRSQAEAVNWRRDGAIPVVIPNTPNNAASLN